MKQEYSDPIRNTLGWTNMPAQPANRDARQYRAAHPLSEVIVPLALAGISAVLALMISAWLYMELSWFPQWMIMLSVFVTFIVVWVWRLRHHDDNLLSVDEQTRVEPAMNVPQHVEANYIHIDMSVKRPDGNGKRLQRFDLPCSEETLIKVAEAMLGGSLLQESEWAGRSQGRPFSQGSLKTFKTTLIGQGIAKWLDATNPRLGIKLTDTGREFMQQVIEEDTEE